MPTQGALRTAAAMGCGGQTRTPISTEYLKYAKEVIHKQEIMRQTPEYLHSPHANHHIPQSYGVMTGDPKTLMHIL